MAYETLIVEIEDYVALIRLNRPEVLNALNGALAAELAAAALELESDRDIGAMVMLGDSASSAGVRRIEALTGQAALDHLRGQGAQLAEIAAALKAPLGEAVDRVKALAEDRR